MTSFDVLKAFYSRNFFRFTGPPENWLTAIKYMTWGLEQKYHDVWKRISVGDVFFMHSTTESLYVKKPQSSLVGIGVVGGRFRIKDNLLWIHEIRGKDNRWPLLVPFSEIYLFSELPPAESWDAPGIESDQKVAALITALLKGAIPTQAMEGQRFPVMGSWSSVRPELVEQIFRQGTPTLYREFYDEQKEEGAEGSYDFSVARDATASIRYVPSLKFLEGSLIKVRRPTYSVSTFDRDNSLLERAEESHASVLQWAIDFFQKRGFDTWSNQHVDLLAESDEGAFLVEVKSMENHNFRTQARRAVGQLFEYEHFDVRKHMEKASKNTSVSKVLMLTDDPTDPDYLSFLKDLRIYSAWPHETRMAAWGKPEPLAPLL